MVFILWHVEVILPICCAQEKKLNKTNDIKATQVLNVTFPHQHQQERAEAQVLPSGFGRLDHVS